MAFNLPPPWNSGYALPGNVRDEGLQRRAFVTKQMPRGTYYQSRVGTGGYVVPQYVLDEGYGQGAATTKWAPSGSYPGKAIPYWLNQRPETVADKRLPGGAKQVTIQRGLSGIQSEPEMPEPFEQYGQRAATILLGRMAKLPPAHRKSTLKKTLDAVDPSLWKRTAEIARRYNNQGMSAAQALHQGLARAMSTGVAAEIITTGAKREAPQARSLLGLGCYGCGPLLVGLGATNRRVVEEDVVWVPASQGPQMEQAKYDSSNWLKSVVNVVKDVVAPVVNIGSAIGSGVASAGSAIGSGVVSAGSAIGSGVATAAGAVGSGVTTVAGAVGGGITTAGKAVYNAAGKPVDWVVDAAGKVYDAGGAVVGAVKDASGAVYDAGGAVVGWVKDAAEAVGQAVKDGLDAIGDLTCDLLSSPAGTMAAAGAAAAAGIPPAVGAMGAGIAKQQCGGAPPPVIPPTPAQQVSSVLPVAMLAGGTILAIYLLTGRK